MSHGLGIDALNLASCVVLAAAASDSDGNGYFLSQWASGFSFSRKVSRLTRNACPDTESGSGAVQAQRFCKSHRTSDTTMNCVLHSFASPDVITQHDWRCKHSGCLELPETPGIKSSHAVHNMASNSVCTHISD